MATAVVAALAAAPVRAAEARVNVARLEPRAERMAPREAGEPIMAIVSIKAQQVTFYDADGWIFRAPVSTGVKGRETPAGVFAILEKNIDHHSNLYDDASMPHMQRLTWNGIAMHGGPLPGYAASHGCVRLPYDFAETLFDKTRVGMRVIISPETAVPVDISHPVLLVPDAEVVAAAPQRAEAAVQAAEEAALVAADAKKAATKAQREVAPVANALKKIERFKAGADAELASAEKALASAKTEKDKARAEERRLKAETRARDAVAKLDAARAEGKAKIEAAQTAKDAAKAAEAKKTETAAAAAEANLAIEPVSIFISRATQKLYVRRNTQKPWSDGGVVYDTSIEVPVTIRDPEMPIGTHVFTAMAQSDNGLRWTAVTIDGGDEAKNALDRVTIPKDVLDKIGPTALPRSSIVISDEELSRETNFRTEFVAVLSNQPQGGFITRKPTPPAPVASNEFWGGGGGFFDFFGGPPPPKPIPPSSRRRRGNIQAQEGWNW